MAFCSILLYPHGSSAVTGAEGGQVKRVLVLKSIAVLPFENLTTEPTASQLFTDLLRKELKRKGWVRLVPQEVIEEYLAKRRIRYTGAITRLHARQMGKELDVDAILLGSVNLFYDDAMGDIHAGLSVRIVSTIDGSIIWADSRSLTGGDFITLFGLGRISDIRALAMQLVNSTTDIIAKKFFLSEADLSPFEIEEVRAFPPVARGGEEVLMQVRIFPIMDEPGEVKIRLAQNEVVLKKRGGWSYEGKIVAPEGEGMYPIQVVASDGDENTFSFDAVSKVMVDNTPPMVGLVLNTRAFSPARKGFLTLAPKLKMVDEVEEWTIDIMDEEGRKIRSDRGFGSLPKLLIWRGETDENRRVEDGYYTFRFVVRDRAGNVSTLTDSVKVKNVASEIGLDVDIADEKLTLLLKAPEDERFKSWDISLLNKEDGSLIEVFEGGGEVPSLIEYEMDEGLDLKKTSILINAEDEAGNVFTHSELVATNISKKAAVTGKRRGLIEDF